MTRQAFTLVELLVVIAIIALLLAILLPTFSQLEIIQKQTRCQKNLSDIHKVFRAYCTMNDGKYPWPVSTWFGDHFCGQWNAQDAWAGLGHVKQLMQVGGKPEIFYCPFGPNYGNWDRWSASTWTTPFRPSWSPDNVRTYTGYLLITHRGGTRFADGRGASGTCETDDDLPIVADRLHVRLSNSALHGGWDHGGGWPEGLFNASGNTLFNGGYVRHVDANEFDWGRPGIVMGSTSQDAFWFATEY